MTTKVSKVVAVDFEVESDGMAFNMTHDDGSLQRLRCPHDEDPTTWFRALNKILRAMCPGVKFGVTENY